MDRFKHFRIVDSDETDSEEEPTLQQPHRQPPSPPPQLGEVTHTDNNNTNNDTYGHEDSSSHGSALGDGDGKRLQPTQPDTQEQRSRSDAQSGHNASVHATPPQEAVTLPLPPASSPDPRNPQQRGGATPSIASTSSRPSKQSKQSETPSAAQMSIKAFSNRGGATQQPPSLLDAPANSTAVVADTAATPVNAGGQPSSAAHATTPGGSRKSATEATPPASQPAASNRAPSSSAHSAADAAAAAPNSALVMQLSPQQRSEADASAPSSVRESAREAAGRPVSAAAASVASSTAASARSDGAPNAAAVADPVASAATAPQSAEASSPQVAVDAGGAGAGAAAATATEAPPKQKKASAGCFSSSKKKEKDEAARDQGHGAPQKKEKASGFCGALFSKKKKKTDAGATAPVPQQTEQTVDVAVGEEGREGNADAAASAGQRSEGELSIPVAAGAAADGIDHLADPAAASEKSPAEGASAKAKTPADEGGDADTQETRPSSRPSQKAEHAGDDHPVPPTASHTASSLSFAVNSESGQERTEEAGPAATAGAAATTAAMAAAGDASDMKAGEKDRHPKRVKAVVRRKRQKPEKDADVEAENGVAHTRAHPAHKRKDSDSETHESEVDAVEKEKAANRAAAASSQGGEEKEEEGESVDVAPQRKSTSAARSASHKKATSAKEAAAPPAGAAAAAIRRSAERSKKRESHPASGAASPSRSGSYSSYYSYSGSGSYSYSYSDSYTASSAHSGSSAASQHAAEKPVEKNVNEGGAAAAPPLKTQQQQKQQRQQVPQQPTAKAPAPRSSAAASSSAVADNGRRQGTPAGASADGRMPRWSVRADDLVLREEDPPASMPAYQRRILLDLRARERRDAEEAARDLRELTFRPRIHVLPGQEAARSHFIEEERSHSPGGGRVSPAFSPASGASEVSPRRYSIRHISPHLLEPRKAPPPPAAPSFKPEISEFARKEVTHDRGVFQRLYNRSHPPSPKAGPEYSHKPEISDFAKQLYPVPRGGRLPGRHADSSNNENTNTQRNVDDSAARRESVFDRLYRQRNSPGTSPNASPSRGAAAAAHAPSFHPQITEMARRQSEGASKEWVGERLYRQARSPRREQHSPFQRRAEASAEEREDNEVSAAEAAAAADAGDHRPTGSHRRHQYHHRSRSDSSDGVGRRANGRRGVHTRTARKEEEDANINDHGEYDPQREYATQREYGVAPAAAAVVSQSDRASWTSSSLQSSFSVKGPTSMKEEMRRNFSEREAAVEAV